MPYSKEIGPELARHLDNIADVLVLPRHVVVDVGDRTGWRPEPRSAAEHDATQGVVNPDLDGETNHGWGLFARTVCSLHLRDGAEFLGGIAALLREREAHLNPGTLARSAFECAMRGLYVIDQTVGPRERSARALLYETAGAERYRAATKRLVGKAHPAYGVADQRWKWCKAKLNELFPGEVSLSGDPTSWAAAGETYPRLNTTLRSWASWRASAGGVGLTPDEAEGLYDFLCLETHPQSFASHQHTTWEPDGETTGRFVTDATTLTKLVLLPTTAVLDLAHVLYGYHGWDVPELDAIGELVDALWPDAEAEDAA